MIFGLNPWALLGSVLAGIALLTGAYLKGDADAANRYQVKIDAMQKAATEKAQKIRDDLTAQANAAVATLESQNAQAKIVYRTIVQSVDKVVDRPVYRNVCLDDDGLRLVNAALGGAPAAPPDPGKPNATMPTPLSSR